MLPPHFHQHRHPVRPVNLIGQVLVIPRLAAAGAFLDRALDVIVRHACSAAPEQHHPQARVHTRVTAPKLGGNGNFLAQLREYLPALRVNGTLEGLNL
jgi:hypothetical protein